MAYSLQSVPAFGIGQVRLAWLEMMKPISLVFQNWIVLFMKMALLFQSGLVLDWYGWLGQESKIGLLFWSDRYDFLLIVTVFKILFQFTWEFPKFMQISMWFPIRFFSWLFTYSHYCFQRHFVTVGREKLCSNSSLWLRIRQWARKRRKKRR